MYSAHNDLLPFIIIESFKARSGFFVPIKPGFVSPELMTFPRFPSLSFFLPKVDCVSPMNLLASYEKKKLSTDAVICWTNKKCEIYRDTNLERSHRAFQSLSENAAYRKLERVLRSVKKKEESVAHDNSFYNKISDAAVKQRGAGNFVSSHVPAVWLSCAHRIQMSQSYTVAFVYM